MKIVINDRFSFTEVRPSDKAALVQCLNDRDIYDHTSRIPFPYTEADADNWLTIVDRTTREQGQPLTWAIRDERDELIGALGFVDLTIGKSHRAEIGYWLAKSYWGRGIISAAVARACRFAFEEWGLEKIAAHVFAGNRASVRVLEKCGFEREGCLRRHFRKENVSIDADVFGLLKMP